MKCIVLILLPVIGFMLTRFNQKYPVEQQLQKPIEINAPSPVNGTVTDIDGNVYKTVVIGKQTWMAENLKTFSYRDGSFDLAPIQNQFSFLEATSGAFTIYHGTAEMDAKYGKLYNWYAVNDSHGLCPEGWHIPSVAEWEILFNELGGKTIAGSAMKSVKKWANGSHDTIVTNSSGFSALPGGRNIKHSFFSDEGLFGYFWTSTQVDDENANHVILSYRTKDVRVEKSWKSTGFSCRCVKD